MTVQPTFQPQNPALSGYNLGWASCTAFSAAMAASYERQVPKLCTGGDVRRRTGDFTGGLNLAQIDGALQSGWKINLDVRYRYSFEDFADRIDQGQGAVLQGHCRVFVNTEFNNGASVNHAIYVPALWQAMDPAADGRRPGIYDRRRFAKVYPKALLRAFAGALDMGGHELGAGLVYAAFTRDHIAPGAVDPKWEATVKNQIVQVYVVKNGTIIGTRRTSKPASFHSPCTAPRLYPWGAHGGRSLVMLTGAHAGWYISSAYAREV